MRLIGSTAGDFFDLLRLRVNNLSRLVPHARSEFLGERHTFELQEAAASTPVARSTPHRPPLNRAHSKAPRHDADPRTLVPERPQP